MTFLQPALLIGLPLAAIPIIIHLVHLYRRRQVKWAAMMFLRAAQRMNKGLSRLRQILILLMRTVAVAALVFLVARPLAGGWLGLTGGAPDSVLVLLDRSASMEQQNPATGISKRGAGVRNIAKAIKDAVGTRSRLVLLDSVWRKPIPIARAEDLLDLPQTEATDAAADIPALLQSALDYISANKTGRTDVWLLSDLQRTDWDSGGGRWPALRSAFASIPGVRFHLLCYPQPAPEDYGVRVDRVVRRETVEKAELLLDFRVIRNTEHAGEAELPVRFVINGTATAARLSLKESELALQAYALPLDKSVRRGWGRVELPADAFPANNVFHFVFDEPPALRSVIVSDNEAEAAPLRAALSAPLDSTRKYEATVLTSKHAAEIPWEDTALIVWQAPLPKPDDPIARQLVAHVSGGRSVIFLPPDEPDSTSLFGLSWEPWPAGSKTETIEWWRSDTDLLANTRDGAALPVGALEIERHLGIAGEGVPLARLAGSRATLMMRSSEPGAGTAWFLGTLPGSGSSSLARDGVVMFAMLHRALNEGALTLGKAQERFASAGALGTNPSQWRPVESGAPRVASSELGLRAGVLTSGDRLLALNRPPSEDDLRTLSTGEVNQLFAGLDFQVLTETLQANRSLTNEIWRTFLVAGALALLIEALLCMPGKRRIPEKESASLATART